MGCGLRGSATQYKEQEELLRQAGQFKLGMFCCQLSSGPMPEKILLTNYFHSEVCLVLK